ncbi:LOW QUALITY PROTEIN: cardiotrophin-like cytokine factor 1 [Protobothrops mucrosquamatus]|uniref:LOW QUALITY PROTEIN: cardiotrophin-like cytokine factor 1 n=1 Tax=Protobothrops mucrosquamatus TaxID=103944 RepID=UPI0010FB0699|nr:LOW QUALITY PROTEIN: cardiotrophin-like cytokine factor 1 [Protobothrops mucrosquamatus]
MGLLILAQNKGGSRLHADPLAKGSIQSHTYLQGPHRTGALTRWRGEQLLTSVLPAGDSWGILAFLCATLWNLPGVPALNRTDQVTTRQSIQQMYDLTRYLEHQLHTLAAIYLNYLGPPFNEPDFDPPRIIGVEAVPSATVDIQEWHSLNDNARLAANYQAYSHLLCYLRTMDGTAPTALPSLRHSLAHFRASLQGLLGSIAGIMASLGYSLPTPGPPLELTPPSHFLRKMDDFWLLKELQTWLWRSAKDFNRLRKRVPPSAVMLHLETRGF